MNRTEFLIVTGLSGLVAALLILQIFFVRWNNEDQVRMMYAQQYINQGQYSWKIFTQVAQLTANYCQQKNDAQLKELLAGQNINLNPPSDQGSQGSEGGGSSAPAPAPAPLPPMSTAPH
jgi:hypothetical protein